MYDLDRRIRNISEYLVADYDYHDARQIYEYMLDDAHAHKEEVGKDLKELEEILSKLYERRKAAVDKLR